MSSSSRKIGTLKVGALCTLVGWHCPCRFKIVKNGVKSGFTTVKIIKACQGCSKQFTNYSTALYKHVEVEELDPLTLALEELNS